MTIKETYPYVDSDGKLLYEVVRYEPKDFRQRRPDGNGGWIWGLGDTPRILFNLPSVISAREICLCQGERDAETAISLGMVGTTVSGGEGAKWLDESTGQVAAFVEPLRGKTVLLIPDNDEPGRIHAEDVIRALRGVVSKLGVVYVPVGKDLSDYIASGATSKDLNKLVELSLLPENSPVAKMQKLVRRRANLTAIESEKLVLGSVMAGRTPYGEIDHLIREDFSSEAHKTIFEAIKSLSKITTDRAAVGQYLEDHDQLEKVGGLSALLDMTEDLPTAYNVEAHTETIQKRSSDRRLLKDLCNAAEDLVVGAESEEVRQRVVSSANESGGGKPILQTHSVGEIIGDIEAFLKPRPMGIGCKPLGTLMADCYGLRGGGLTVIGARPGEGKTSIANSICAYAAAAGHATEILSMEVSNADCIVKIACTAAKVPYLSVISGNMSTAQKGRLYDAIAKLSKLPLRVDDRNDWTIAKIRSHLKKRRAAGDPLKLLAVDYLQMFTSTAKNQRRDLELSEITRGLKAITVEFDLHILLLSQLSRDHVKQGVMPRLSDLRDSGGIESDASMVWLLWQDFARDTEDSLERRSKIIMAKHRNGKIGEYDMMFSKPYAFFYEPGAIAPLDYGQLLS